MLAGIVDSVMQQLQFKQAPLDGTADGIDGKRATHFVNSDDKLVAEDGGYRGLPSLLSYNIINMFYVTQVYGKNL